MFQPVELATKKLTGLLHEEPPPPDFEAEPPPTEVPLFRQPVVTASGEWPPTDADLNMPPRPVLLNTQMPELELPVRHFPLNGPGMFSECSPNVP
jgi:hypothetical protein